MEELNESEISQKQKLGRFPYVIGGLSFIPLIGVLFGIIATIYGLIKWKKGGKLLTFIGLGGITFTVVLYGALFYFGFMQRGGVYDDLRGKLAQNNITNLVQSIEFYKLQNGSYPATLEVLQKSLPDSQAVFIMDPTKMVEFNKDKPKNFYYEITDGGQKYYLLGVGADDIPFTSDDILPNIDVTKSTQIGLVFHE